MKQKSTGSKRTASAGATGRSRSGSAERSRKYPYLAICVANRGNEASLELGKAYKIVRPLPNDPPGRIRVLDEEGEDYLYRSDWFVPIAVEPRARKKVMDAVVA